MRFPNFEKSWEKTYLSKYLTVSSLRNKDNTYTRNDVLSVSGELGIVNQIELLGRSYAGESLLPYHIVEKDDVVYTKSPLAEYPYGIIKTNRIVPGIVSTLYAVYKSTTSSNNRFVEHYFSLKSRTNNYLKPIVRIGAKHDMKIGNEEVLKNYVVFPAVEEQTKIADFLDLIDERITTQSKIIEDIETLRKWIINQQFARTATNTIGEFIEQTSERNKTKGVERVLSVSNKYGFINQSEQFEDREVASDDRTNYKIVRRNDFAFNPARINVGSIAKLDTYDIGIVSPMYICFKSNNKNLDADYLSNFFSSNSFKNALNKRLEGSVRQCLQFDALCDIKLFVPSLNEQISFISKIKAITKKLTIEKDILSLYKKQKAYLLSNMFI